MRLSTSLPVAREKNKLVVQELADETVVYDPERHKAHYLDTPTSLVWQHCDGKTKVVEVARLLEDRLNITSGRTTVKHAVGQLKKLGLVL